MLFEELLCYHQTYNYTYGNCEDEISNIIEIAIGTLNYMLQTVTARHIRMKTRKIIMKAYV